MLKKLSIMLLMSFLFPIILIAKTIVVDQNGNGDYLKINDAVNIAIDGDTIYVRAGIYIDQIIIDKKIRLYSDNIDSTIWTHPEYCIWVQSNDVIIKGFHFFNNNKKGFAIYPKQGYSNILIINCIVEGFDKGVKIFENDVLVTNSILLNNDSGIYCSNGGKVTALNNLIHNNNDGISNVNGGSSYLYNNIIIKNNRNGINNDYGQVLGVYYNCVWSNTTNYYKCSSGLGDISLDPNFYDYENNDFRLRPESPCIDSGHPSSEYNDPDGTRNDMGIYGGPYSWQDDDSVPVELSSFDADFHNDKVILRWRTCTETDNFGFEVQRRIPIEDKFTKISFIKGQGTTTTINDYLYEDLDVYQGIYYYRLKQIDFNCGFKYSKTIEVAIESLKDFSLKQNYINPFNPTTTISFELPSRTLVRLSILDVLGKEIETIINREYEAGHNQVLFNAKDLTSGLYFYRLEAGGFVEVRKLMVFK